MKKIGNIVLVLFCLLTVSLWVLSKPDLSLVLESPFRSLGQIAGLLASVYVSAEFFLATRAKILEKMFAGLDKVYRAHAITGALAFIFMLNHPLLLAINVLPSIKPALNYFIPSLDNLPYAFGIFALYSVVVLLSLTLFMRLPYHIWKRTHIFMAVPQVFILLHILFISSDTSRFLPLKIWILGLGFLSLGAYAYKRFFYSHFGSSFKYEIATVKTEGDAVDITLTPTGPKMEFLPGQFVFLSFKNKILGTEEHPFTISSAPSDSLLRLSIRMSGDYTKKLSLATAGMEAKIHGPYGVFGEKSLNKNTDDIWIAGGIGVTPFLSLLRYYGTTGFKKNVWMFYSTKTGKDLIYTNEINDLAKKSPEFHFLSNSLPAGQRLTAKYVKDTTGDLSNKQIFLCGPEGMVRSLWEQFVDLGVKPKNIIFEEFNFLP